jgi:hypothetical protein
VIEGPIVTIVAGFLTAQGYFDEYWVLPYGGAALG